MARHPLGTGKAAKKRREQMLMRLGIGGAIAFVCVIGILLGLRHESILIHNIHVEGHKVLEESAVRAIAEKELEGSYGFIVPRRSAFFYPRSAIANALTTTHKRIDAVAITRTSLTDITIRIVERDPSALWCSDDESACSFVDDSGYVFASSSLYSGNPYVIFKGLLTGDPVGMQYMPEDEFSLISYFISELTRLSLTTRSFRATADEYTLELSAGGKILFVRGSDLDRVLLALETTLMSESFKKRSLAELEYLDLRFANKAVVKWRNDEAVITEEAPASQESEIQ